MLKPGRFNVLNARPFISKVSPLAVPVPYISIILNCRPRPESLRSAHRVAV